MIQVLLVGLQIKVFFLREGIGECGQREEAFSGPEHIHSQVGADVCDSVRAAFGSESLSSGRAS